MASGRSRWSRGRSTATSGRMTGELGVVPGTTTLCFVQGAAAHPDSEEQQQRLREAAEGLRMATNAAAQNAIKKKLVHKLEVRLRFGLQRGKGDGV